LLWPPRLHKFVLASTTLSTYLATGKVKIAELIENNFFKLAVFYFAIAA